LDRLDELVAEMRDAGLHVDVRVEGAPSSLPAGVDLTAFRIVQEALTNTLKHAGGGARALVELRYLPRSVEVEVTDGGTGGERQPGAGPGRGGHGLIGMAERVSLFGGELHTGVRPDGGFRVVARLPLEVA
jgi:signal transduction histidine kinase